MSSVAIQEAPAPIADLKHTLKEVFGYGQFRGTQEAVIQNVLAGHNTFVIMPTGAGKSLCYQLPALVIPGTAIVISPLIALMKNQVDQLAAFGVNAQVYNSTLTKTEMNRVKKDVINGDVRLLYVAPERRRRNVKRSISLSDRPLRLSPHRPRARNRQPAGPASDCRAARPAVQRPVPRRGSTRLRRTLR